MANIKIAALPIAPTSILTDVFPIVQGGITYKQTLAGAYSVIGFSGGILAMTNGGTGANLNPVLNSIVTSTATTLQISTLSSAIDAGLGAIQGNILYRNATSWVVLPPGTAGQFLQTGGPTANPSWQAEAGTGSVQSVSSGTGLTGGPITTTGTLSLVSPVALNLGGTNNATLTASNGGIVYSDTTKLNVLAGTATAGLALLSGASSAPTFSASPPITRVVTQVLTGSGTYTPTTGAKYVWVRGIAGGGGGGGASATNPNGGTGAGGGGGAYGEIWEVATSRAYSVGAAGLAGTAGNTGGTGGATTWGTAGSQLNLGGGVGGTASNNSNTPVSQGGAGGIATTAQVGISGATGNSIVMIATIAGLSGAGASGPLGGGGGATVSGSGGINGNPGAGFGSGGSGGCGIGTFTSTGGAGSIGTLIVTEYISI